MGTKEKRRPASRGNVLFRRMVATWIVIAIAFFVFGGEIGIAAGRWMQKRATQDSDEMLVYGHYDDRVFSEEISLDWDTEDSDFMPLGIDMDTDLQEFIYYLCAGYNVDFTLVMAMIQQESNFDPTIVSSAGDYGLMQINEQNFDYLSSTIGVTDFLDPYQNVRAGLFILRKLFEKYQDPSMVLMAYNMGESGASKLWENNVFNTNYSNQILSKQAVFVQELERSVTA